MGVQQQNEDGSWGPATPIGPQGWKAKLEALFYKLRLKKAARIMSRWDERGLGK